MKVHLEDCKKKRVFVSVSLGGAWHSEVGDAVFSIPKLILEKTV